MICDIDTEDAEYVGKHGGSNRSERGSRTVVGKREGFPGPVHEGQIPVLLAIASGGGEFDAAAGWALLANLMLVDVASLDAADSLSVKAASSSRSP
jgi:hypothetical protein